MDFSWPSPTEDEQSSATALPTQQGTSELISVRPQFEEMKLNLPYSP